VRVGHAKVSVDPEARSMAQKALDGLAGHERFCLRLWRGAFITLFIAVVGYVLTKVL